MTVATDDRQRRAGEPAGSFASLPGAAMLDTMTATLTSPTFVGRTEEPARLAGQVVASVEAEAAVWQGRLEEAATSVADAADALLVGEARLR